MAGCRGPVTADEGRRDQTGPLERAAPSALALGGGVRILGSGEVPHGRVAERDEVLGGGTGTRLVVGLHDSESLVRRGESTTTSSRPAGVCALRAAGVASFSTIAPSTPWSRRRSNASARAGRVGRGHDGECVAAGSRGIRDRLQHARVADRRERRDDEPDRVRPPGAQRSGRAVRPVAEPAHGRLDALPRCGVHARTVVDDSRYGLAGHAGKLLRRRASTRGAPCRSSLSGVHPRLPAISNRRAELRRCRHVDVTMACLVAC